MTSELSRRISFALNVVLGVIVGVLVLHKLQGSSRSVVVADVITNAIAPKQIVSKTPILLKKKSPQYVDFTSITDRRRWVIDQLREMGVPNDTLALVARMDLDAQWDARFQQCWGDPKRMAAVQLEMDLNKDADMRAALGDAGFKQWDQKNMLWEAMSVKVDVNSAEADAIYNAKKILQQRMLDLEQAKIKGTMDDADISEAQMKAYSEYNQQMKNVLGDERYAKSQQMDDAFQSDLLRHQLASVNPTDSQLQDLFKAEQKWTESLSQLDSTSPDYTAQYKALNAARDQEYEKVLGSDVYNTYQEQQNSGYSEMKKYENLWGLDDSKIDYVYNTMKTYQKSVQDYQSQITALQAQGQNVDWETVNKTLQQLAGQAQQSLQDHLGQDSFNKLERNRLLMFTGVLPAQ